MTPLSEQIDAMLRLGPNWDGYGADPIQPYPAGVAKEVVKFIAAVTGRYRAGIRDVRVYPTRVGGVQIEWADPTHEHELEIRPDGSLEFVHENSTTREIKTVTVPPGPGAVAPAFLNELSELVAA